MSSVYLHEQALKHGIIDESYGTVRNGWVQKFKGVALVVDEDGTVYAAFGEEPQGNAEVVTSDGGIRFIQLKGKQERLMSKVIMINNEMAQLLQEMHEISSKVPFPSGVWSQRVALGESPQEEYDLYCEKVARRQKAEAEKSRLIHEAATHRAMSSHE